MAVRVITYDLSSETSSEDYEEIIDVIKSYPWARLSESCYAIETTEQPATIYSKLLPYLDENDSLLVLTLKNPHSGVHEKDVVNWLARKLP